MVCVHFSDSIWEERQIPEGAFDHQMAGKAHFCKTRLVVIVVCNRGGHESVGEKWQFLEVGQKLVCARASRVDVASVELCWSMHGNSWW